MPSLRSLLSVSTGTVWKMNGRTLVNPGKPIPAFITQLTGITNEMVRNAPTLQDVLQELADFVRG